MKLHIALIATGLIIITMFAVGYAIGQLAGKNEQMEEDNDAMIAYRDMANSSMDKASKAKRNIEKLLQQCIDKGMIKRWYYNGEYHWE